MLNKCSFYRFSENIGLGKGLGHCDLDSSPAICEGDIQFCENPELLRSQLSKKTDQEKGVKNNTGKESSDPEVLLVDDEEPIRKLLFTLLSKQGYRCVTATNGAEALNKIIQNKFRAVITDIAMPGMDGIALTKETLSLHPDLPIMVMTGFSQKYPTESALSAGARDFIAKPFSNDEFIVRFKKMLSDHEKLTQIEAKHNEMALSLKDNLKTNKKT